MTLQCPDCGGTMVLKYSPRFERKFYGCTSYPKCSATHGAHPDGRPLGIPGDRATKDARIRAHAAFDRLWNGSERTMTRKEAYRWLDDKLGVRKVQAHIGAMDVDQCTEVCSLVRRYFAREIT